jgi:hypothetical protein
VTGVGRLWLRFCVAGAFVLAVVGDGLMAVAIAGILALLVKFETRS